MEAAFLRMTAMIELELGVLPAVAVEDRPWARVQQASQSEPMRVKSASYRSGATAVRGCGGLGRPP